MKVVIGIILGFLSAAVIGSGIFFYIDESRRYRNLKNEHSDLTAQVAEIQSQLDEWKKKGSTEKLKIELDSIFDYLTYTQPFLPQILTVKNSHVSTTHMVVSEPLESSIWNTYPFELTLEGDYTLIHNTITDDLASELPLMQIDHLEAGLIDDATMEFNISGSVLYPREVVFKQSEEMTVSASASPH